MQLFEMTWPEVAALSKDTPILIPIAALEQHGEHMPLFTDSLLLGEVIRRTSEVFKKEVVFTPLQWFGNSEHHLDFPGTMTASPRLYLDLLRDMIENFLFHGFRRIVLVNGHGGNIVPGQQVVFELRQKYRDRKDLLLISSTYWSFGGDPRTLEPSIEQTQMGHACEWETSMMLKIRPDLVKNLEATSAVEFGNGFEPAHRGWTMPDRSAPGHIGDPRYATAEKGEAIFSTFTADLITFIRRVLAWDGHSWNG